MLQDYQELKCAFRAYDPDKMIVKIRIEYDHPSKETKDEYKSATSHYKHLFNDNINGFESRWRWIQRRTIEISGIRNPSERNRQSAELQTHIDRLNADKKAADEELKNRLKNVHMELDYVDYELPVAPDAAIRKKWAPKLFDDKGKPRDLTNEDRLKYKGPDPKQPGYLAKFESMDVGTPMTVKYRFRNPLTDPDPEPRSPGQPEPTITDPDAAATTKTPTATTVLGTATSDTAATKKQKRNANPTIEERPLITFAMAERNPGDPVPAPKAPVPARKY